MPAKGEELPAEHRLVYELGWRAREVRRIAAKAEPTSREREKAAQLGREMAALRRGEDPYQEYQEVSGD